MLEHIGGLPVTPQMSINNKSDDPGRVSCGTKSVSSSELGSIRVHRFSGRIKNKSPMIQ